MSCLFWRKWECRQRCRQRNRAPTPTTRTRTTTTEHTSNTTRRHGVENDARDIVYVDYAGMSPAPRQLVLDIATNLIDHLPLVNPHSATSSSSSSSTSLSLVDAARAAVRRHYRASADDFAVVFAANTSGAIGLLVDALDIDDRHSTMYYSRSSHTSVLGVRPMFSKLTRYEPGCADDDGDGDASATHPNVVNDEQSPTSTSSSASALSLCFITHACNVTGRLEDIAATRTAIEAMHRRHAAADARLACLVDAASSSSSHPPDLGRLKCVDFVVGSMAKITGSPTGVGFALVRRSSAATMFRRSPRRYGGGSVARVSSAPLSSSCSSRSASSSGVFVAASSLESSLELGTLHLEGLLAVPIAFSFYERTLGGAVAIRARTKSLVRAFLAALRARRDDDDAAVDVELRGRSLDDDDDNNNKYCAIVSFSLFERPRRRGRRRRLGHSAAAAAATQLDQRRIAIGFGEVGRAAVDAKIALRVGCCCNVGACARALGVADDAAIFDGDARRACGDDAGDVVDNRHTGVVRVSFGHSSTQEDVDRLMAWLDRDFFYRPRVGDVDEEQRRDEDNDDNEDDDNNEASSQERVTSPSSSSPSSLFISSLYVYPIKSCGGFAVRHSHPLTSDGGMLYDRHLAIFDVATGRMLTLKTERQLARIRVVDLTIDGDCELSVDGDDGVGTASDVGGVDESDTSSSSSSRGSRFSFNLKSVNENDNDRIDEDRIDSGDVDVNDDNAAMNSSNSVLSRLGAFISTVINRRVVVRGGGAPNSAPLLVVFSASIRHVEQAASIVMDERSFRPNVVVDGGARGFEEDAMTTLTSVDDDVRDDDAGREHNGRARRLVLRLTSACSRCRVVNVGGSRGEPLRSLSRLRRIGKEGKILFGMLGAAVDGEVIEMGTMLKPSW